MNEEFIFLVAFLKFYGNKDMGCKRIDLHGIFKTEEDARKNLFFNDEAGFYNGVLIEKRRFGNQEIHYCRPPYRIWFIIDENGELKEIEQLKLYKNIINII